MADVVELAVAVAGERDELVVERVEGVVVRVDGAVNPVCAITLATGRLTTWVLQGQNGRGWYGAVALRRLVTSRKGRFTWRTPGENPYIVRDETRSTIESRYADVAFAMSNA